jgi:demethylmenaquinone methyltransferase/2-methoxy-6-polyprenyl-1,4-benzoquinol methylase
MVRENLFSDVWTRELNDVFADVAPYYDRANYVASLGLWGWFRKCFLDTIALAPGQRVLDVCAGTNAIGMALLEREPRLEVHAIDRSAAMQAVGQQHARERGFHIESYIGDVHRLPFPDDHFDVVTLQSGTSITATCCAQRTRWSRSSTTSISRCASRSPPRCSRAVLRL